MNLKWLFGWVGWALTPLVNEMGAIPSSLTDEYDALLTTTLRAVQPKLRDNITRGNKILAWLEMKGRWRSQDGGERVQVPLMHAQNSTADIFQGYGILDTTPQDGITSAFFDWAELAVSITISGKEERQNSGRSRILGLLESKTMQAEASIRELLNNCIVAGRITASAASGEFFARRGRLDTSALGPLPLARLIDTNRTRSISVGNINGNTYSFWRNQATSSSGTTFMGMKQEMSQVYNDCSKGVGGSPDLMIGDQRSWEQYYNSLHNLERYIISEPRILDILGGSDAVKFRGATFIWDEVVPDTETNAEVVDGVGTVTAGNIFYINSEAMSWITDAQTNFITTPFVRPENQRAKVAQILWMGAIGINNRRKLGVLYGIARNIVS